MGPRVAFRTTLVFSGIFTFLVDAYPTFAASALAANSFMRSSFGGIFPLFGIQSKFVNNLGLEGLCFTCSEWISFLPGISIASPASR